MRRQLVAGMTALLALLGLSACGSTPPSATAAPAVATPVSPADSEPLRAEPLQARPQFALPLLPDPKPRNLVGMTRSDVAALLGPPTLLRSEPPAEVWQYTSQRCVLHVFLYREGRTENYRARHVELRTREARRLGEDAACFRDFVLGLT